MKSLHLLCLLMLVAALTACEDVVSVNLQNGRPQLTVDAWVNSLRYTQEVRLSMTAPYLQNTPSSPATGAVVTITDITAGRVYAFTDPDNNGTYTWQPVPGDTLARLDRQYRLDVSYQGESYESFSTARRVPAIDSLSGEHVEPEGLSSRTGFRAEVYARDFVGTGDHYWIKSYQNGRFLNKAGEINIAKDASVGFGTDGIAFILPIRRGINPDPPADLFQTGDTIRVEIHSMGEEGFVFWTQVREQINNGGLFATPLANVPTNIRNRNAASANKPVGFFNVALSSERGLRVPRK